MKKLLLVFVPAMTLAWSTITHAETDIVPPHAKASEIFSDARQVDLAEAIGSGSEARVAQLIEGGVDLNAPGKDQITLLLWSLAKEKKKAYENLLRKGADPNIEDTIWGESVVSLAALHKNPFYLKLALEFGGNPNLVNHRTSETPIFGAIKNFRTENIRILIDRKANLDFQGRSGFTPMMTAAGINQFDSVYLLLQSGADPDLETKRGVDLRWVMDTDNIDKSTDAYQLKLKIISAIQKKKGGN